MKKIIQTIFKQKNFLIAVVFIILYGIIFHTGYKEHYFSYFLYPVSFLPALSVFINEDIFAALVISITIIVLSLTSAHLFWNYMDLYWLTLHPDTTDCDGPCTGWFSFENQLHWEIIILYGLVSLTLALIIKLIYKRIFTQKNK
jgi:hypothetical protein